MKFVCLPSFLSSNVQAANIKFELADELNGKYAYVEAIKLYEEARDIFVQVYLTVAVLKVCHPCRRLAAAVVLHWQVLHACVPQALPATSDSVICSS